MPPKNIPLQTLVAYLNSKYEFNLTGDCLKVKLVEDLGIYGDDIDEILGSLVQDFDIKISKIDLAGFNVGKEPFDFISTIATIFRKKTNKREITIEDILQFVNTGVLVSEFNPDKNISKL